MTRVVSGNKKNLSHRKWERLVGFGELHILEFLIYGNEQRPCINRALPTYLIGFNWSAGGPSVYPLIR